MGKKSNALQYHLMLAPGMVFIIIFGIIPLFGIAIAFQDFIPVKGITGSKWVGFDNFIYMFQLDDSKRILFNTLYISILKMIMQVLVPVGTALLLHELVFNRSKRWFQTIIYLPHFLSWVILAGILTDMLSAQGIVNKIVKGLFGDTVFFLGSNFWFPIVVVLSDVWKEFGFNAIIFLAALTAINPSLYEAAEIDGAGRLRKIWSVTLPGILPTIVLITTLNIGQVLNAGFDQIYNLYNPLVYQSGDIIDTYVYRIGLVQYQFGLATAVGSMKSLVGFVLIFISYRLAAKYANYRIF
ncbi:sugar ABC transporter permease [Paenibacillus sp. 19GGS1-52]|uniref:ABC transporter permease n=1 Tax=Paenibacillus sp. 19GGS1-52 TaxID=2758563 RepID=UPI001EFA7EED|nr:ABC transporter permease subunit [Paenibacillus sp. 19GGS1-52]ULO07106.1 sugar ABC transporter permease [Paenibacillus sp. 19GGS1-52]